MHQDALSLRHWRPPLLHHTRKDKGAKAIYDRNLGAISCALQESCIDKILHYVIPLLAGVVAVAVSVENGAMNAFLTVYIIVAFVSLMKRLLTCV